MPKKRHRESPFNPELVAAITKELPAILAKEGYFKNSEEIEPESSIESPTKITQGSAPPTPVQATVHTPVPRGNTKFLWYSVAIFGAVILAIWGFNLRSVVNSVWSERTGHEIIDQGQDDFKSILETIKENDKIAKEQVRAAAPVVTSTPTTTPTSTSQQKALDSLVEAIKANQNN